MASDTSAPAERGPGYEFTADQNAVIGDTAKKMNLVGLILIIFGFLNLINAFLFQILYIKMHDEKVPPEVREQWANIGVRERWIITGYLTIVGVVLVFTGTWT